MGDFAVDTRVEGSNGSYRATLSRDWEIWGPNGGYLAVIALRAAGAETDLRRPATFVCHFLNVAEFGGVDLAVHTLRASKRATALRVSMTQQTRPILEALVWVVDAEAKGLEHDVTSMPAVPGPQTLKPYEELNLEGYPWFPFWKNLETREIERISSSSTGRWRRADRSIAGPPTWRAWLRYRPAATFEDPFVDAGRAVLLLDTMTWPAAVQPHPFPSPYIAPSMDVSVQFHRSAPRCEWLFCDTRAPVATGGLIGGQSQVWSADGRLLATGISQLFCRPNPMYEAMKR
jgi:acyl-CoA thioesterase